MDNQEKQHVAEVEARFETLQKTHERCVNKLQEKGYDTSSHEAAFYEFSQKIQDYIQYLRKLHGEELILYKDIALNLINESIEKTDSRLRKLEKSKIGCAIFLVFLLSPMLAAGMYGLYALLS